MTDYNNNNNNNNNNQDNVYGAVIMTMCCSRGYDKKKELGTRKVGKLWHVCFLRTEHNIKFDKAISEWTGHLVINLKRCALVCELSKNVSVSVTLFRRKYRTRNSDIVAMRNALCDKSNNNDHWVQAMD